jgi:hypothetical protein
MGFDCEIEQVVQMQYSVTPVRADRIGETLAATLKSALEPGTGVTRVVEVTQDLDA